MDGNGLAQLTSRESGKCRGHFLPLTRLPARFDPVSQPDIQDRLQQALGAGVRHRA